MVCLASDVLMCLIALQASQSTDSKTPRWFASLLSTAWAFEKARHGVVMVSRYWCTLLQSTARAFKNFDYDSLQSRIIPRAFCRCTCAHLRSNPRKSDRERSCRPKSHNDSGVFLRIRIFMFHRWIIPVIGYFLDIVLRCCVFVSQSISVGQRSFLSEKKSEATHCP